jgi:hypothetical protein
MKKTTLAIIITLIAGIVVIFVLIPHPTEAPVPNNTEPVVEPESAEISGVGTLSMIDGRGERLECTVQYQPTPQSDEITGSYFVDGEQVRGDFVQEDATLGQVVTSYIVRDDTVYVWSLIDGESYGIQTALNAEGSTDELPVPQNQPVRYSCEPWVQYDASIFIPPSNVLFRDPVDLQAEFGTIYEEGELPF